MCGIGGFYAAPGSTVDSYLVWTLGTALEDRGRHASGAAIYWQNADQPIIEKAAVPFSRLAQKVSDRMGTHTQYALLHTRYTTQGSTANNGNNHPVARDGLLMTHNGVISNDDDVFRALGVRPQFQVDTECLVAGLAVAGPEWTFNNIRGSASVAWVDRTRPDVVCLFTNGRNPLVIGRLEDDSVVWASCMRHLDDLPVKTSWHATPGRIYELHADGSIKHDNIDGQWPEPCWDGYARVY